MPPGIGYPQYRERSGGSLSDLLLERGRIQSEASLRSGDIWGQTFANIGQTLAGGIQQHAAEKQIKKRDAAWLSTLEDPEFWKDPKTAYSRTVSIWGPGKEADEQFKAALGAQQLMQPKRDPKADREGAAYAIRGLKHLDPVARAAAWPKIAPAFNQAIGSEVAPPEYSDDFFSKSALPFSDEILGVPTPKTREVKTRNADGSETTRIVEDRPGQDFTSAAPPKPPETRSIEVQLADAATRGDQDAYSKLLQVKRDAERAGRAPAGPKEPRLVPVKTVNAEGKAVTRYVTPKEGDEFAEPTGAGKPATGQQRKALGFFNRGKEADEIAASLEEGGKISPTKIKYTPGIANFLLSDSNQAYKTAQRAFTESRLRKDSGATIKDEEYENDAVTYFPQPGDSEATKKQKRASRKAILAGIALESGDALREFYGDEAEGMMGQYRQGGQAARPVKPAKIGRFTVEME